jgi:endonuclease/exonuclease/phosphatase family metal-dependent hydrolase
MPERLVRVVTYNVHRCYGPDGKYDPFRVAQVLCDLTPDIVGLQEVDTTLMTADHERRARSPNGQATPAPSADELPRAAHRTQLDFLAEATGLSPVEGLLLHRRWGVYGNALLTRHRILDVKRIDLTVRGASERRGALDVGVEIDGLPVRVFVTHLGLQLWERHFQISRLLKALGEDRTPHVIMMGDFNLWMSILPRLRRFYARLGHAPIARTFPSRFPLFSLDRIWVQPARALRRVEAYRTVLSVAASDHLPLVADVDLDVPPRWAPEASSASRAGENDTVTA